eukprot:gene8817-biopygen315
MITSGITAYWGGLGGLGGVVYWQTSGRLLVDFLADFLAKSLTDFLTDSWRTLADADEMVWLYWTLADFRRTGWRTLADLWIRESCDGLDNLGYCRVCHDSPGSQSCASARPISVRMLKPTNPDHGCRCHTARRSCAASPPPTRRPFPTLHCHPAAGAIVPGGRSQRCAAPAPASLLWILSHHCAASLLWAISTTACFSKLAGGDSHVPKAALQAPSAAVRPKPRLQIPNAALHALRRGRRRSSPIPSLRYHTDGGGQAGGKAAAKWRQSWRQSGGKAGGKEVAWRHLFHWRQSLAAWRQSGGTVLAAKWRQSGGKVAAWRHGGKVAAKLAAKLAAWRHGGNAWRQSGGMAAWRQSGGEAGRQAAAMPPCRHAAKAGGKAWRHGGMAAWRQNALRPVQLVSRLVAAKQQSWRHNSKVLAAKQGRVVAKLGGVAAKRGRMAALRLCGKALRHSSKALRHSGKALRHSGKALRHSGIVALRQSWGINNFGRRIQRVVERLHALLRLRDGAGGGRVSRLPLRRLLLRLRPLPRPRLPRPPLRPRLLLARLRGVGGRAGAVLQRGVRPRHAGQLVEQPHPAACDSGSPGRPQRKHQVYCQVRIAEPWPRLLRADAARPLPLPKA